jgi:hypothetical protein
MLNCKTGHSRAKVRDSQNAWHSNAEQFGHHQRKAGPSAQRG